MNKSQTIILENLDETIRLSDLKPGYFPDILSKNAWKKAIKAKRVNMNGTIAYGSDYIKNEDTLELLPDLTTISKPLIDLQFDVLYEDEDLAVINKPSGILVSGNKRKTIVNALAGKLKKSLKIDALSRPEPVHRLDYLTSGPLLIAKTAEAVMKLNKLFENRKVEKTYLAVCVGTLPIEGHIETDIETKSAHTSFRTLACFESPAYGIITLCKVFLHSGRRHQIRIHFSSIAHPILGDADYGSQNHLVKGRGHYLHATTLRFSHPTQNKLIEITAEVPKKFVKLFPDTFS